MPATCGHKDKNGYYCVWGTEGKHYYYKRGDKSSMERAREKAKRQGRAIQVNKSSGIQSLRFDKKRFNKQQAITWAKSHGFKSGDVEEMPNEWRLRQFDPKDCLRSGGMKGLDNGVRGYICLIKSNKTNKLNDISIILENISNILNNI